MFEKFTKISRNPEFANTKNSARGSRLTRCGEKVDFHAKRRERRPFFDRYLRNLHREISLRKLPTELRTFERFALSRWFALPAQDASLRLKTFSGSRRQFPYEFSANT